MTDKLRFRQTFIAAHLHVSMKNCSYLSYSFRYCGKRVRFKNFFSVYYAKLRLQSQRVSWLQREKEQEINMSMERNEVSTNQGNEAEPQEMKASLFERLVPILFVKDLHAERNFYVSLGFTITYQGAEFPDFIALGYGSIEFGISRRENFTSDIPDHVLNWQFGVKDIDTTRQLLTSSGVTFREELVNPSEEWKYRVLHAHTPNGYHLMLEGPRE